MLAGSVAAAQDAAYFETYGYRVSSIDKRNALVFINAGIDAGLDTGDEICFYQAYAKPVGCHRVTRILADRAAVSVPKNRLSRFTRGMIARKAYEEDGGSGTRLDFGYVYSAFTPFVHNTPIFNADSRDDPEVSPWSPGSPVKSSAGQIALGVETPFGPTSGFRFGLLIRILPVTKLYSGFFSDEDPRFVETQTTDVALGVPMTARWLMGGTGKFRFLLGAGAQYDVSQVRIRSYVQNDETGDRDEVASFLSVLHVVSLKAELGGALILGRSAQIQLALGLLAPVADFGGARTARVTLPDDKASPAEAEAKLVEAVGHGRSKVGLDVAVTARFAL